MSGGVYDRNRKLVTQVYMLGLEVFEKNEPLAERLMNSIMPLLRYDAGLLSNLSRKGLEATACIRQDNMDYVFRILQGESIDNVAKDIPVLPKREPAQSRPAPRAPKRKEPKDSSAFHMAVRTLEDIG